MKCSLIVILINLYAEKHRSEMKMMEGSAADLREQIKNEFQGLLKKLYNHFCSCGLMSMGFKIQLYPQIYVPMNLLPLIHPL